MGDASPRRALPKTALKALGLAALVCALLVVAGVVLASAPVRGSRFGKRMERRFPIGWSRVALVFGPERERVRAVDALFGTWNRRAVPLLERAAGDRSRSVAGSAMHAIDMLVQFRSTPARRSLLRLCRASRPALRCRAYRAVREAMATVTWRQRVGTGLIIACENEHAFRLDADVQAVLREGLGDSELECRRQAATTLTHLLTDGGPPLQPEVSAALRRCLRGPSPGIRSLEPAALLTCLRRADTFDEFVRQAKHVGCDHGDAGPLLHLWEAGTPKARRLMEQYWAKHPLGGGPR